MSVQPLQKRYLGSSRKLGPQPSLSHAQLLSYQGMGGMGVSFSCSIASEEFWQRLKHWNQYRDRHKGMLHMSSFWLGYLYCGFLKQSTTDTLQHPLDRDSQTGTAVIMNNSLYSLSTIAGPVCREVWVSSVDTLLSSYTATVNTLRIEPSSMHTCMTEHST